METFWFNFDSGCIVPQYGARYAPLVRDSLAFIALCNFIPTSMHPLVGHITPYSSAHSSVLTFVFSVFSFFLLHLDLYQSQDQSFFSFILFIHPRVFLAFVLKQ